MYAMPVGVDNFREMVSRDYYFVDKTNFIKELLDNKNKVTLITRPRRFGKTLAMRMLQEFFDINAAGRDTFKGLNISRAGEKYIQHRGKYPVIFFSLKDIATGNYQDALRDLCGKISDLYAEYGFLAESPALNEREKEYFLSVYNIADHEQYGRDKWGKSLKMLTVYLWKHYGVKTILLLDEYDAPIQHAWEDGYYEDMIRFMRQFYSEVLKGNDALEFAVLTGVLRVAKESIFSGLNNLKVCSVLSEDYSDIFGFTGQEVARMAADLQLEDKLPEIREWYDGYSFGGSEIYNPWSVIMYFDAKCKPAPYWVNTSGNGIIKYMLDRLDGRDREDLQSLMDGNTISKQVQEGIIYEEIGSNADDLYTMLLTTGYLKCTSSQDSLLGTYMDLQIPNLEILRLFTREIAQNFTGYRGVSDITNMMDEMLKGNAVLFEEDLNRILRNSVSYHDAANGESFYHGMMLGFCVLLKDTHIVQSNRESGYGRFDLALIPTDRRYYGVIMEFKRAADEGQLEEKALEALAQIEELSYIAEFQQRQIEKVWKYGIAFCGKKVCLRGQSAR
ncbi:AAA family ATPase [Veillonellaceae bacterium WCA-693-APC-5D-A]|uniref:AAA family ATPase n=2 Tax=Anaerovibrio slackiae TaxID=2652309 RepID=A0A6I2UF67_9FIRM|nr:AAA family ATPase [Anaerovibrio slackiae]MSU08270.1 AAA family ATPase [Anaerovibrio slackiae]